MKFRALTAFAFAGILAATSPAVELVYNGGFDLTDSNGFYGDGWTVDANFTYPDPSFFFDDWSAAGGPSGVSAWLGYTNLDEVSVSQSINTLGYSTAKLKFDLFSDGWDDIGLYDTLDVYFGSDLLDTIDLGNDGSPFDLSLEYDLTPYLDGSVKTLSFSVINDISLPTWSWVDNVSIDAQPVPEPATIAALGLGAAAILRRRRRVV